MQATDLYRKVRLLELVVSPTSSSLTTAGMEPLHWEPQLERANPIKDRLT